MTSFRVAVTELAEDAQRFADAATTTKSIGDVLVPTPANFVDDWGWWDGAAEPIQSVIDAAQQLVDAMNRFTPTFYRICRDQFIASMGTASSLIASCILAFEGVKRLLVPMLQEVHDFIKGLRAPAKIKALGTHLIGEPVTTMHELGNAVSAPALSTFHWEGAGADAYRKVAEAHRVAFQDLHDTFKPGAESPRGSPSGPGAGARRRPRRPPWRTAR